MKIFLLRVVLHVSKICPKSAYESIKTLDTLSQKCLSHIKMVTALIWLLIYFKPTSFVVSCWTMHFLAGVNFDSCLFIKIKILNLIKSTIYQYVCARNLIYWDDRLPYEKKTSQFFQFRLTISIISSWNLVVSYFYFIFSMLCNWDWCNHLSSSCLHDLSLYIPIPNPIHSIWNVKTSPYYIVLGSLKYLKKVSDRRIATGAIPCIGPQGCKPNQLSYFLIYVHASSPVVFEFIVLSICLYYNKLY